MSKQDEEMVRWEGGKMGRRDDEKMGKLGGNTGWEYWMEDEKMRMLDEYWMGR